MVYTVYDLQNIKQKIIKLLTMEIDRAYENNEMDEFLEKYNIDIEEDVMPVDTRTMKILVVGASAVKLKDLQLTCTKMHLNLKNIEFENDYNKLTNLSLRKLENSNEYSDIIIAANPHKQVGLEGYSSIIAKIKDNPDKFPKLQIANANDKLKLTITNFKDLLLRTRYFDAIN